MTRQLILTSPPSRRPRRRGAGEMAGAAAADCAAVCCCAPCAVVDLAVLAVYTVPKGLIVKAVHKRRRRRMLKNNNNNNDLVLLQPQRSSSVVATDIAVGHMFSEEFFAKEKPDEVELENEMWARTYVSCDSRNNDSDNDVSVVAVLHSKRGFGFVSHLVHVGEF
ncbi:hypothetical protein RJT34_31085 [Clitoria ternatea]|uniref:Uncharacterized protein n=1 Tax=Clitoria ternatea TaxID=43366 RepID=A0AAN9EUU8_CLITE